MTVPNFVPTGVPHLLRQDATAQRQTPISMRVYRNSSQSSVIAGIRCKPFVFALGGTQNPPITRSWGFDPPSRHSLIHLLSIIYNIFVSFVTKAYLS